MAAVDRLTALTLILDNNNKSEWTQDWRWRDRSREIASKYRAQSVYVKRLDQRDSCLFECTCFSFLCVSKISFYLVQYCRIFAPQINHMFISTSTEKKRCRKAVRKRKHRKIVPFNQTHKIMELKISYFTFIICEPFAYRTRYNIVECVISKLFLQFVDICIYVCEQLCKHIKIKPQRKCEWKRERKTARFNRKPSEKLYWHLVTEAHNLQLQMSECVCARSQWTTALVQARVCVLTCACLLRKMDWCSKSIGFMVIMVI